MLFGPTLHVPETSFFVCVWFTSQLKKNMEVPHPKSKQNDCNIGYNWNDVDDVEDDEDILGYCSDLG